MRKSFDTDQLLINLVTSSVELNKFDLKGFGEKLKAAGVPIPKVSNPIGKVGLPNNTWNYRIIFRR